MTQKPLGKKAVFDAKKAKVANRHGKVHKQRKGGREFTNTKESKEDADVRTEITRLINQRNEQDFARKASQSGGSLAVLRPPPDKASAGKGKHFLKPNLKTAAQL